MWFLLHCLTFIRVQSGRPSARVWTPPWPLCGAVSALKRDWAGVDGAMLVLTEFLAVVVGIKLKFYVNLTGVEQTHACVGIERNVTYFSVNKLLVVGLGCDNGV